MDRTSQEAASRGSGLRFDRDFGFHRIGDEALLVRGMIHLFELFCRRLFVAGKLQSLV
jgi:hypothetical protein